MSKTISLSDYDYSLQLAKKAISDDKLVIYPTDTLYGLGCNALSPTAVEKVYGAKQREGRKPLSIIVTDFEMLLSYCEVSPAQQQILHELLPGPYTFIVPLRKNLPVSSNMEVGVRVPEHFFMRQAAKELGVPIVSTSANLSGQPDAAEASAVDGHIKSRVELVVDGGKCRYAQGSTVIDLIRMKVLRKGAVRKGDRVEW